MAMMYTSEGWVEVKLPPFLDLDEICRKQDEEEERLWQQANNMSETQKIKESQRGIKYDLGVIWGIASFFTTSTGLLMHCSVRV